MTLQEIADEYYVNVHRLDGGRSSGILELQEAPADYITVLSGEAMVKRLPPEVIPWHAVASILPINRRVKSGEPQEG